jgi:acyl-CoA thioesterase I
MAIWFYYAGCRVRAFLFLLTLFLAGCSQQPAPVASEPQKTAAPAAVAQKVDDRKVLVVFGDSLAAGYGLEAGQSFPDDLQHKLDEAKYPWRVVNLGISGDTTEGGASRIESATSLKPQIVVLELGGNDGLRGLPLAVTRQNMEAMVTAFQTAGARVVLAGITLPPNYGPDYIKGFDKIYKDLAAEHHLTLIPFLLGDIVTKDLHYFQRDGIHPTADGAQIVAGTVFQSVQPLLGASN